MGFARVTKIYCDSELKSCHHKGIEINYINVQGIVNKARAMGWAVSRDRRKFYCPDCAKYYRTGVRHW